MKWFNGNRCSLERWGSEEKAKEVLASLTRCSGCSDCSDNEKALADMKKLAEEATPRKEPT